MALPVIALSALVGLGQVPATPSSTPGQPLDLTAVALSASTVAVQSAPPSTPMRLVQAWWIGGLWAGVASDPDDRCVYALTRRGVLRRFDASGSHLDSVLLPGDDYWQAAPTALYMVKFAEGAPGCIVRTDSKQQLRAFGARGGHLWTYAQKQGVNDARPVRVHNDPSLPDDGIALGHNGGGVGVVLLNLDGTRRWTNPDFGNVWNVCPFRTGDGSTQIAFTEADGRLHVLDSDGKPVRSLASGKYVDGLCTDVPAAGEAPKLVAFDPGARRVKLVTPTGEVVWDAPTPEGVRGSALDAAVSKARPWLAVAFSEGVVAVYDIGAGRLLASETLGASHVAWTPVKDGQPPRLVVDGFPLRAFDLVEPPQATP